METRDQLIDSLLALLQDRVPGGARNPRVAVSDHSNKDAGGIVSTGGPNTTDLADLLQDLLLRIESSGRVSDRDRGERADPAGEPDSRAKAGGSVSPAKSRASLSPREQEIVRLVAKGLPNKAIALVLDVSPWTIAAHLKRVFAKLEVSSRAEMIARVMQDSLLSAEE